ncbi:ABC transporter permease [Bacteriovorax stolpii]|uniref:ABC transporter permease n=1 Tax=Bacteriovorax stolpii TaxID=960 RepID=A0A2K9NWT1_BACTC|nr:ABC transporter permease [Bacteriovorax stolpii]AUN99214.1 ABC transporter permease [Bacteriovorax stolpii]QDK40804.1 ABC transporter permease [Bacteriovorax stolpii]TDP55247.1 simple sugar transport system permease protein [Bacteriovorax stolpii]
MKNFIISILSVVLGLLVGGLVLKLSGISPLEAYQVMWEGAFSQPNYISYIIIRSTPLILTGLSVAFAFRTGLFNIGAEGQFVIGALSATYFGYHFDFSPWIQVPLVMMLATMIASLYGGLSGFLKARFGVHEVLSTIMLNWIALYLSNYAVFIPGFRRPDTETTEFIKDSSSIGILDKWKMSDAGMEWLANHEFWHSFMRPPVNAGIFIALICVVLVWVILNKTAFGYKLKAVGFSPNAAEYAGISTKLKVTQSMMIAGALSGLAGATHVMGVSKNVAVLAAHEGYGFDGIAVALIGSNHPVGVLFSGFFLGALKYSGQKIQSTLEAPSEVIGIMIGAIIFFIAIPSIFNFVTKAWRKN